LEIQAAYILGIEVGVIPSTDLGKSNTVFQKKKKKKKGEEI
jgi:hypothetical protein